MASVGTIAGASRAVVEDDIINEQELCRRLGISTGTASNWRNAGRLPYIRLAGRSIRYHWGSVVQAMLRAQRGGTL